MYMLDSCIMNSPQTLRDCHVGVVVGIYSVAWTRHVHRLIRLSRYLVFLCENDTCGILSWKRYIWKCLHFEQSLRLKFKLHGVCARTSTIKGLPLKHPSRLLLPAYTAKLRLDSTQDMEPSLLNRWLLQSQCLQRKIKVQAPFIVLLVLNTMSMMEVLLW